MMRLALAAQGLELGRDRGPDAARRRRSLRRRCPSSPSSIRCSARPRRSASARLATDRRSDRRRRLQQLGGLGRAHALGQAAAGQRSAPAAERALHLVSRPSGAASSRAPAPSMSSARRCRACRWSCSAAATRWPGASPTPAPTCRTSSSRRSTPTTPSEYLTPDGWRPFATEPMAIAVKGAGVRTVERRRTRHGPVLPGFYRNLEGAAGRRATWRRCSGRRSATTTPPSPPACSTRACAASATTWSACASYVVPMQSMVVADTDGNIGMIAPGRVPVRDPANKVAGRAPVPGWDATYDWKGYLKFEDLPRVDRSARGRHRHGQCAHRRARLSPPPDLRLGRRLPPAARQGADRRPRAATTWPACARPRPTCSRRPFARLQAADDRGGAGRRRRRRSRARPARPPGTRPCARTRPSR